jgi:hypothetical protein
MGRGLVDLAGQGIVCKRLQLWIDRSCTCCSWSLMDKLTQGAEHIRPDPGFSARALDGLSGALLGGSSCGQLGLPCGQGLVRNLRADGLATGWFRRSD